jgi:hypothetical protein
VCTRPSAGDPPSRYAHRSNLRARVKRSAILLSIAVLLAACRPSGEEVFKSRFELGRVDAAVHPGTVLGYTADLFKVESDATLVSARPASKSPGVEVVDVRATYLVRSGGRPGTGMYLGSGCWSSWPPPPDEDQVNYPELGGLKVKKGDQVAVMFFIRAKSVGNFQADGVALNYRLRGGEGTITTRVHKGALDIKPVDEELPPEACTFRKRTGGA